jgi:hypothetical protein
MNRHIPAVDLEVQRLNRALQTFQAQFQILED